MSNYEIIYQHFYKKPDFYPELQLRDLQDIQSLDREWNHYFKLKCSFKLEIKPLNYLISWTLCIRFRNVSKKFSLKIPNKNLWNTFSNMPNFIFKNTNRTAFKKMPSSKPLSKISSNNKCFLHLGSQVFTGQVWPVSRLDLRPVGWKFNFQHETHAQVSWRGSWSGGQQFFEQQYPFGQWGALDSDQFVQLFGPRFILLTHHSF